MPPWLELTQVIVGTGFVVGTIVRGGAAWVFSNTIKRDLARLGERIDELKTRVDDYDGSAIWSAVQVKVGGIETDQKLLSQRVGYLADQVADLRDRRPRVQR